MEFALLGSPAAGPTLRLDHRLFSYAGKFVMSNTGKAVARAEPECDRPTGDDRVAAAVSFNDDRTDPETAWLRYLTAHRAWRGTGVGARLAAFAAAHLLSTHERVRIAVNNPFAYHALHKAGFGYTGERTGIAELVLERPGDRSRYAEGLAVFDERDLSAVERSFLDDHRGGDSPERVADPPTETAVDTSAGSDADRPTDPDAGSESGI